MPIGATSSSPTRISPAAASPASRASSGSRSTRLAGLTDLDPQHRSVDRDDVTAAPATTRSTSAERRRCLDPPPFTLHAAFAIDGAAAARRHLMRPDDTLPELLVHRELRHVAAVRPLRFAGGREVVQTMAQNFADHPASPAAFSPLTTFNGATVRRQHPARYAFRLLPVRHARPGRPSIQLNYTVDGHAGDAVQPPSITVDPAPFAFQAQGGGLSGSADRDRGATPLRSRATP